MIRAFPFKIIFCITCVILTILPLNAADFSEKDSHIIYTKVLQLLNNYQDLINQIGEESIKTGETPSNLIDLFNDLFLNRKVYVYNDLDPSHQLSGFYEVETYSANLALWYKDGMQVKLDLQNARVGEIHEMNFMLFCQDFQVVKWTVERHLFRQDEKGPDYGSWEKKTENTENYRS